MNEVKVAIIGFGGIARAHYQGYLKLKQEKASVRLVAVCDVDPGKFTSRVEMNISNGGSALDTQIHTYTDVSDLIEKEDFDMADICLPSYLHKEFTVKLLNAGKHVLCEKPMALSTEQCDEMIAAAEKNGKKLMIGQCLRFHYIYSYLKDRVADESFGKLKSLYMYRRSPQPRWGFEHWFEKTELSGGCIMDMHIHDIDMARYLLGEPLAVSCMAYDTDVRWAVENSRLYYKDAMVVADGSWDESPKTSFSCGFSARFEKAQIKFENGDLTVYPDDGEVFKPTLSVTDHTAEEIRYFASLITDNGMINEKNPPISARQTVGLVEMLRKSADNGGQIIKL